MHGDNTKADIKLIVFDLDDTLLDSNSSIKPRTNQVIQQVVAKGIKVTLATGRMHSSAIPYAKSIGIDVPVISYNGALITSYPSGERLFHHPIKEEVAKQLMQLCRERQWYIQTYINDTMYVKEINDKAELYAKITGALPIPVGDRLYTLTGSPTKLLIITEPEQLETIKTELHNKFGNTLCVAESKPNFLEINDPIVNKGTALRFIANMLGINPQNIMAFGNGTNDIDMLRYSGWGVAVGNSSSAVKSIARLVTGSNNEEGVADLIEKYILI